MSPVWSVVLVALSFSQFVHAESPVDVCFVLDESIDACEWEIAKIVISALVNMMDVGPEATQVGLVQFARRAKLKFDLDHHDNKDDVLNAINGLTQVGGSTKLSSGLVTVRKKCFGKGHGERAGAGRLAIMLTGGKSTVKRDNPGAAARAVRKDNIALLVVGVDNPDVPTINIIANNVAENTFLVGTGCGSIVTALFDRFKDFCARDPASIRGCDDVTGGSGRLVINIAAPGLTPVYKEVLCDNGWLVLLRRQDGSVNFTRTWADYKDGFGQLDGEFWAGLELMYRVTHQGRVYSIRVDLETSNGTQSYVEYSTFTVGPESDKYRLHVTDYLGSSPGYSFLSGLLSNDNSNFFTTIDQDNDSMDYSNCAWSNKGGWWYSGCMSSLLTGLYSKFPTVGINWDGWGNYYASRATMKIRHILV